MELYIIIFIFQTCIQIRNVESVSNSTTEAKKLEKLPPCAACRVLSESFKQGMDRTVRGKFEGGDSAWEEVKMGTYKTSEVRLIEIQEKLCSEVVRGQKQCHANSEEHEHIIEDWWFNRQDIKPNLYDWLCIETLEVCCPANHFGPACLPCKGGATSPCGGNGRCKGNGTRKGNGECDCNDGYSGELCAECSSNYFKAYEDENKVLCNPCHKACQGSCIGAGPRSCLACKEGWAFSQGQGCRDVNECIRNEPCKDDELCINNEGSYTCIKCDRACDGCSGDGPDMCNKCKEGFDLEDGICVDNTEKRREESMEFGRYVTYAGLTIATCIILQKDPTIAAVIGILVAAYITFSEYYFKYLQNEGNKSNTPLVSIDPFGDN